MLVLKLRPNDSAHIGPYVTITVLRDLESAWLVLGIDAPPEWRISRTSLGSENDENVVSTTAPPLSR